jgi:FHS family L-fucose permease-like MFS transporter
VTSPRPDDRRTLFAFAAVTSLFFAWGFITSNNDPLIAALRTAFHLSYTEALLTQIIFFVAFGLLSLPAAWLSGRLGLVDTTLAALLVMAGGCFLVSMATGAGTFAPILAALFVVAAGYTTLQVAANPLAALLGSPERSHFRLNLAQAFNSLGVVIGVHFGSRIMLGPGITISGDRIGLLSAVNHAYRIMALVLAALALLWLLVRTTVSRAQAEREQHEASGNFLEVLKSRWAIFGAVAIGLYVGAEVSIGSIMINFLNQPRVLGLPLEAAGAHLANFYWGGALVGRILGTLLLTRVRATRLLAACAAVDAILCATVLASSGLVAGYAALAIGFFNSIMFPTIFTITLERSRVSQSSTSGLLCLAIFGGAVLPMTVGMIADRFGLGTAFAVPLAAYAFIAWFAVAARDRAAADTVAEPPTRASPIP